MINLWITVPKRAEKSLTILKIAGSAGKIHNVHKLSTNFDWTVVLVDIGWRLCIVEDKRSNTMGNKSASLREENEGRKNELTHKFVGRFIFLFCSLSSHKLQRWLIRRWKRVALALSSSTFWWVVFLLLSPRLLLPPLSVLSSWFKTK